MAEKNKTKNFEFRWDTLISRSSREDCPFFYAVKTTGIFCRPGCSSRLPKKENVEFFDTIKEAVEAGYRPCKRCKPLSFSSHDTIVQKVITACRKIEESEDDVPLEELAAEASFSPWHFQRLFKEVIGFSPKEYSIGLKAQKFRRILSSSLSVTEAIYDSGFGSSSRVYEQSDKLLAMNPSRYKNGGSGLLITYGISKCFLGHVLVAFTKKGICTIEFGDDPDSLSIILQKRFNHAKIEELKADSYDHIKNVIDMIDHPRDDIHIPLDIQGTIFQEMVWKALRLIPSGKTRTYSDIALEIGHPRAVRAVANACAENKLAIAIPCHRVVRKDGSLGGYRWGTDRKQKILDKERKDNE